MGILPIPKQNFPPIFASLSLRAQCERNLRVISMKPYRASSDSRFLFELTSSFCFGYEISTVLEGFFSVPLNGM